MLAPAGKHALKSWWIRSASLHGWQARPFEGGVRLAPRVDRYFEIGAGEIYGCTWTPGDRKYELGPLVCSDPVARGPDPGSKGSPNLGGLLQSAPFGIRDEVLHLFPLAHGPTTGGYAPRDPPAESWACGRSRRETACPKGRRSGAPRSVPPGPLSRSARASRRGSQP